MELLKASEISCRVQQIGEKGLSLLLYVTSRDGQKRLDEKYGPLGWQDSYQVIDGDLYCTISAWDKEKQMWVSKEDVGIASFTAKEKGRASDAFKRACVKHGIARELYTAPFIWLGADVANIKQNKDGKYITYDKYAVNYITYTADGKIDELEIVNQNMDIVFKQYPSGKIDDLKHKCLVDLMKKAEVTAEQITSLFHVTDLKELSIEQFVKCTRKLEKTIETKGSEK